MPVPLTPLVPPASLAARPAPAVPDAQVAPVLPVVSVPRFPPILTGHAAQPPTPRRSAWRRASAPAAPVPLVLGSGFLTRRAWRPTKIAVQVGCPRACSHDGLAHVDQ
ncbi:hypothetical protein CcI156_13675 [Frankia sp. CcI156]|nr:hypothetical protein CcI156_13675 [Frankia sp. CcI156]